MTTDLLQQVQQSLGDSYVIGRELGGGGMSRVFLATDRTLDRAVVVKILSPELTAGVSVERFRREIQIIAGLQHPHIVPLLSAGQAGEALYYIMPFRGGESVRARLAREGPLPVADTVRILRDVLDALAFAHSRGVIHRDIKPDNILLEAGHAVVADFGVAKALRESGNVTSLGVALGTPMYMAPEQAAADPATDHRADLYAVGIVAYEMLTASPPFTGTPTSIIRDQMIRTPVPLRERRPDVPDALAQHVMRALEKDATRRPQSAAEMMAALDVVLTPQTGTMAGQAAVAGAPRARSRWLRPAAAVVLLAAMAGAWVVTRPRVPGSAQSLAIAPFSVAAGDTALVRLGQNLVTTVSANLDGVGEIRVADPMAVLSHASRKRTLLAAADAMDIARALGARSVVHGTLTPEGGMVRADAALYDAAGGREPLARISVRAPRDSLAALTDSLTWRLLRAIWSRGTPPTPVVASITTHSPEALRQFLEGERLFSHGDILAAAEAYKRSATMDTTFWFAHYKYRMSQGWMSEPVDTTFTMRLRRHLGELPERERAFFSMLDSTMTQSQRVASYQRLTRRYPDYAPVWVAYADYLVHHAIRTGHDAGEAIEPWKQAVRLMPGDFESANHLAYACLTSGNLACALPAFQHFDSLVRADSSPTRLELSAQRTLLLMTSAPGAGLLDSLIQAARRDSAFPVTGGWGRVEFAPVLAERPHLVAALDTLDAAIIASGASVVGVTPDVLRFVVGVSTVTRGDYSRIDELVRLRPSLGSDIPFVSRNAATRLRALGELQGFVAPSTLTATAALRDAAAPDATHSERVEARWIAAMNALLRNDGGAYSAQVAVLRADTSANAAVARRSLAAIALGRAGNHAAAADSLLAIEHRNLDGTGPGVFGAAAADRLLAAQWLADEHRYAEADSLLRFTRGFVIAQTAEMAQSVFAASQLVRSRIAEGVGDTTSAVAFARMFLVSFDRAPASQRPLLDEAKQRIARLSPAEARLPKTR